MCVREFSLTSEKPGYCSKSLDNMTCVISGGSPVAYRMLCGTARERRRYPRGDGGGGGEAGGGGKRVEQRWGEGGADTHINYSKEQ